MKPTINLDEWNLTKESLANLTQLAQVSIHIRYPGYKPFVDLVPQERRRAIALYYRRAHRQLTSLLSNIDFQRLGTHIRPIGTRLQIPLVQLYQLLPTLMEDEAIDSISIEAIEGLAPIIPEPQASFWSIQARFAIQIENQTTGIQTYEDRILIVKAFTEEDAQQKLLIGFEKYAEPYLNSSGLMVRWQFEKFTDSYPLHINSVDEFLNEEGVEVFSKLGTRRLPYNQQRTIHSDNKKAEPS